MNARASQEFHMVTVAVEQDGPDDDCPTVTVRFECTAPEDATCRTYPDCGCEAFTEDIPGEDESGHPYITGRPCWVGDWFDCDDHGTAYAGEDADECNPHDVPTIAQRGHIAVRFVDESVEWEWVGVPERLPVIMPPTPEPEPEPEPEPDPRWAQTGPSLMDVTA